MITDDSGSKVLRENKVFTGLMDFEIHQPCLKLYYLVADFENHLLLE